MFSTFTQQKDDLENNHKEKLQQMRYNRRNDIFLKRCSNPKFGDSHLTNFQHDISPRNSILVVDQRFRLHLENFLSYQYTIDMFPQLVTAFNGQNLLRKHYGIIGIRRLVSVGTNPPIQAAVNAGIVPRMMECVQQDEYPQIQLEAAWAISNVASGTTQQCQTIVEQGGIPIFVQLLNSKITYLLEHAIWTVANISSDCIQYRDAIIKEGGVVNLTKIVDQTKDVSLIKIGCWALSCLCRNQPLPEYDLIKMSIPVLCRAITEGRLLDQQTINECYWAISNHCGQAQDKIKLLADTKLIPKVISRLQNTAEASTLIPCIRILGGISLFNNYLDELLASDILFILEGILSHRKKVVRREVCWLISNIAAGDNTHVRTVLARQSLLNRLLQLFHSDKHDVCREICYVFSNFTDSGDPQLVFNFYKDCNIILPYLQLLASDDSKTIEAALECLYIVLGNGEKFKVNGKNFFVESMKNMDAVNKLEELKQLHSSLSQKIIDKILQTYFYNQEPIISMT